MKIWIRTIGIILCLLLFVSVKASAEEFVINVTEFGGSQELIVGDSGRFQLPEMEIDTNDNIVSTIYQSKNPEILSVEENGTFYALTSGRSTVSISVYVKEISSIENDSDNSVFNDYYENNNNNRYDRNDYSSIDEDLEYLIFEVYYEFIVKPDLSQVTLENTSQVKYITNDFYMPEFTFQLNSKEELDEYDSELSISYQSEKEDIDIYGSLRNNVITIIPNKTGAVTVTITMNEKQFKVYIKTVLVSINKNSLLMSKKQKKQLKIKGVTKRIQWSSSNQKVVKVSSKGTIRAGKNGNAVIKAKFGDISLGCAVSVVSKSRQKAIKKAIRIGKTCTYSQAHRMEKNYYDCSSLVWKAYAKNGNNFGNATYAPVAADEGKWCAKKKRILKGGLSDKNIRNMKINAGDLMFETSEKNNGRYRGIYHVEIISGYICYGFNDKDKPILGITWANRPVDYYWHGGQMIGRP